MIVRLESGFQVVSKSIICHFVSYRAFILLPKKGEGRGRMEKKARQIAVKVHKFTTRLQQG